MNKIRFTSLICGGALALSLAMPLAPARAADPMQMQMPASTLGALASTNWELSAPTYAGLTERPTLQFDQNRLSASVGLNRIGGDAKISGQGLQISPLFSTKMAGPREQMNAEFRYMQALEGARSFTLAPDGKTLTLRGAQTLTFLRADRMMKADPLDSTQWQLTAPAYAGLEAMPTLQFMENRMSASVGLNSLNANYKTNGAQLKLEQFLSTLMAGSPAQMSAEDNYKRALEGVRTFAVSPDGQTLTLSGAQTLTFAAMAPMEKMAKAGLSTHVLDTTRGTPGAGVVVKLYRMNGENGTLVRTATTNADGRVPELLSAGEMQIGVYQIVFSVGPYFQKSGLAPSGVPFLDDAVVRFGIGNAGAHYHVPITVTPYSYSTYRGS